MGRVLAGVPAVRATRSQSVVGGSFAGFAGRDVLAAHPADAGLLSADRSGQRVAIAPAVVRAERDGGSTRRGRRAGGEERALPLPRQAAGTQDGAGLASA